MKKVLFALVVLLLSAGASAFAQESNELAAVATAAGSAREFRVLAAATVAATVFDIESTFYGLGRCPSCGEANPLVAPFIKGGRPAVYGIEGAMTLSSILLANHFRKSQNPSYRRMWRWALLMPISIHVTAGSLNFRLAKTW